MARLQGSWLYGGLPGGTKLLRYHRLLKGLADHLANHLCLTPTPKRCCMTFMALLPGRILASTFRAASRRLATAPSTRSAGADGQASFKPNGFNRYPHMLLKIVMLADTDAVRCCTQAAHGVKERLELHALRHWNQIQRVYQFRHFRGWCRGYRRSAAIQGREYSHRGRIVAITSICGPTALSGIAPLPEEMNVFIP